MEKLLKPDRKYFIASLWIHLTVSISLILLTGVINLIINLAGGDPNAVNVIWIICISLILITWIIVFPLVQFWIRKLSYSIGEERITIHKGIITKTQQNIPYRAITDFALQRGPYDRILGIGSIKVQTAGQSHNPTGYEGSLSGMLDFENLMVELRAKIKLFHPGSEDSKDVEPIAETQKDVLSQILKEIKEIRKTLEK